MYYSSGFYSSSRVVRLCSVRFFSTRTTKKLLEFLADMPKANSARISEAQRQRQNITKKSDKYAPSTVYLQVIGSGAKGAPNTLYLFTDQKRYLFNCGECTQRLAHEHKVKLSRLDHIFITAKSWKNIGGLPGLSLTLQDVGVPNITLHGPEGLDELYSATKRFVIMKEMNVTMAKCSPSEDFDDNALTVKYVLLGPQESIFDKPAAKKPKLENDDKEFEEFINDDTDYYKSRNRDSKKKVEANSNKIEASKAEKPQTKTQRALEILDRRAECCVAYICTLKKRFGTLDLAKCVEMGVKPGPMLGQLKSGQDVVLPDGKIVLSKDVKTPDDPGPVFIVLEIPDISYLKESEFKPHFDKPENPPENIATLVVHLSPPHVVNHATYRAFMMKFGRNCRHLVLNSQNTCLGSEAVHRSQHKLHLLDSEIFPLLNDKSMPVVWNSNTTPASINSTTGRVLEDLKNQIAVAQFQNIIKMEGSKGDGQSDVSEENMDIITPRTLTMFQLRPKREVDRSAEPKLHIQEYIQEAMVADGFVSSLEQFRLLVDKLRPTRSEFREYPQIVFLGTGSCIPSKTRNTSAFTLRINENQSMLMDCGEGTFGQLVRFFGPRKVNSFLRTLKAIYISHLHADHHIGLIGVLQARREAFKEAEVPYEPLYLLAPGQIISWLTMYDQQFEKIKSDFTLIPNQNLLIQAQSSTEVPSNDISPAILASIGLANIQTCLVNHCPNAFGVCVDIDGRNKVTYSGDTIPCEALVQLGKNSTLLIHEATMEDELADEARVKMHSTTSQAIDIGKQMNATYTLLTHFSQRYARLPRLSASILNDNNSVGIAFDNMAVSMSDLCVLPHMYAPLQLMFAEHCVEMEMKAQHRARQKQRRTSSPNMPQHAEQAKARCISPGCRTTAFVTISHANYRETIASKLRQESKGMAVSGVMKGRTRSSSLSSTKQRTSVSPADSRSSDTRSPKRNLSEKYLNEASRTISETSNSSRDTYTKYRGIPSRECVSRVHVIDTRSRTINSVARTPSIGKASNSVKTHLKACKENNDAFSTSRAASRLSVSPTRSKNYGKPLVTPVHKKLSIIRQFSTSIAPTKTDTEQRDSRQTMLSKSPIVSRARVVTPGQAIHKHPFNASPKISENVLKPRSPSHHKVDIITSVLIHIILWRVGHLASYLYSSWPLTMAFTALSVVCWTAVRNVTSTISATTGVTETVAGAWRGDMERRPSSANTYRINANKENRANDHRPSSLRNFVKVNSFNKSLKTDSKITTALFDHVSKSSPQKSSTTRVPKDINILESNIKKRKYSSENLNQQFYRESVIAARRTSPTIHNSIKSFKPQLEDIKSSFLLLNKKQCQHKKNTKVQVQEIRPISKKLDDHKRQDNLNQIKQKFRSKEYCHDSRYEKIEGLNWISWKN